MLCLASILVPVWSNANPLNQSQITLDELVKLIPRWEVPRNSPVTVVGDGGRALGHYQIHSIMVRDYNRITGKDVPHVVAFDPNFSEHIAKTVLAHYYRVISSKGHRPTVTHMLYIWNGGGSAWTRVHNPRPDSKQLKLERYAKRALTIINQYTNEQTKRKSPQGTQI